MLRIAIPVETKNRELRGKLLLALYLHKLGFEVIIGSSQEMYYNLSKLRPDVFFMNNADFQSIILKNLQAFKRAGGKIVLLENEGGILRKIEVLKDRLDRRMVDQADYYFAWSKQTADFVIAEEIFSKDQVVITGHPNFDLLNPQFKPLYEEDTRALKKRFPQMLLVNTNFSIVNEAVKGQYAPLFSTEHKEYLRELMHRMEELIIYISKHYPDKQIVVRPHPSENLEYYASKFKPFSNIHVIHQDSVHPWLFAAEVIIHNSCTTGLEAALAKIKPLSYQPIANDEYDMFLPNFASITCLTHADILEQIGLERQDPLGVDKRMQLSDHLANFNQFAYQVVASHIESMSGISRTEKFSQVRHKGFLEMAKPYLYNSPLKSMLPEAHQKELAYQNSKYPITDISEVNDILMKLTKCLDYKDNVKAKKVGQFRRIYKIESANT